MSEDFETQHWPIEIRYLSEVKRVEIEFDDGVTFSYSAELLRVESPSAEVQGHAPSDKTIVAGRQQVGIIGIEPVGHYAIRIKFDDLHDTGLYSWGYLYRLGENQEAIWQTYLTEIESRGLSREPPARR